MKIQALKKMVYDTRPLAIIVYAVEDVACGLHRQRGEFQPRAVWGNSGDLGGDANTDVAGVPQLLHHCLYFPGVVSLGVQNRLGVVEDNKHFPGGQERSEGGQVLGVLDAGTDNV
jgi:hypothetical protein